MNILDPHHYLFLPHHPNSEPHQSSPPTESDSPRSSYSPQKRTLPQPTQHQPPLPSVPSVLLFSLSSQSSSVSPPAFRVLPFSPRSGGGSPVFFLSGCLPRPRVLPSGGAAGSARTLRSVLPLKAQAQPPVLLLCFLPLPLQLPIPLPPFSNPQPFFLPSSAPVSFSAVLLFLSFSSSSVPRHFPCCNRS